MSKKHSGLIVLKPLTAFLIGLGMSAIPCANAADSTAAASETGLVSTLSALVANGEIVQNPETGTISTTPHAAQELGRVGLTGPGRHVDSRDDGTMNPDQTDQFLEQLRSQLNPDNFQRFTQGISAYNAMSFHSGGGG